MFKHSKRKETPESKKYKQDQKKLQKHVSGAVKGFHRLIKRVSPLYEKAKLDIPENNLTKRKNKFVKYLKSNKEVSKYLDAFLGKKNLHNKSKGWRNQILYLIRDYYFKASFDKNKAANKVSKYARWSYEKIQLSKDQQPIKEVLPEELFALLPENIVVEVDPEGSIQKITDRFKNEFETLSVRIDKMKTLVSKYNKIVEKIQKDLKSSDELRKLSALIAAIMLETGIRPGKKGNSVIKIENGEDLEIKTFGAITLGPDHVNFIKDNFAEIRFIGKKGQLNVAELKNPQIIKILKSYTEKAMSSGSPYIFVTSKGETYSYKHYQRYFRENVLSDFTASDFRKLKATKIVIESLHEKQKELYEKILYFVDNESEDLKNKIRDEIINVVTESYMEAYDTLSHENFQTTIDAYINPEILFQFLSSGEIEKSIENAILNNSPKLEFNVETFIQKAKEKNELT